MKYPFRGEMGVILRVNTGQLSIATSPERMCAHVLDGRTDRMGAPGNVRL